MSQKENTMEKKIFYPNGGEPIPVSSLKDIVHYMGEHLDGFPHIEICEDKVLIYHKNDPSAICIGFLK